MPKSKRKTLEGRGAVGKTAVVGAKDRDTNQVSAQVIRETDAETLQGFVAGRAGKKAAVYTDDAAAYKGMPHKHESVRHSAGEYVRGDCHTNGIESFWSMLKRAHKGTFHKISPKHLQRYVHEFAGKHNVRETGHHRPDAVDGCRDGRKAAALSGPGQGLNRLNHEFLLKRQSPQGMHPEGFVSNRELRLRTPRTLSSIPAQIVACQGGAPKKGARQIPVDHAPATREDALIERIAFLEMQVYQMDVSYSDEIKRLRQMVRALQTPGDKT